MTWFDEAEELLAKWKRNREEQARYWSRFSPRARQVLSLAIKEARETKLEFVGCEHLLIGLLEPEGGLRILTDHGLTLEIVRAEMLKFRGGAAQGGSSHFLHTPPTLRLKRVLEVAMKEAKALSHTYVGTYHLLLALLAENDGVPRRIFRAVNIDPAEMRNEILREMVPGEIPPSTNHSQ